MNERRLHPFTVLRFLRKTLVVYLLPLVQVLFERNWTALHTALQQDALLFLLLCAVSWGILHVSSWSLDNTGVFHLHWRLGIRLDRALRGEMLAALTIDRPLLYRMAGASRLTLYPVGAAQTHTLSVCLPKADAEAVADQLMPLVKPTQHRPAGGERAALGFLGANGLSTLALFVLAVRQTRDVPDWNPAVFAQIQVSFLARFAAQWLPAGAAWLLAAAGFLLGASLMRSFAQTVHYTVWHTADQVGSRGGWLGHFECRVRTSEISFADVRISPAARLMKRWPVFVTAGGCSPELPLFVYRSGEEALFRELLPEFQLGITRTMPRQLDRFATLARTTAIKMRGEIHCWGCCRDSVVEYRQQDCMRTATTATIRSDARLIHILAMVPHIIEQYLGIQSLNHMGTVGLMRILAIFSLTLSPAIQVEIYTDSPHSCQGSEALLLIGTISATTEMTVGTDNQRMLALLGGRIDGTEDMLTRQGLDTNVLNRITIIPAYLS